MSTTLTFSAPGPQGPAGATGATGATGAAGAGGATLYVKAADELVTSSTTLQDDNDLTAVTTAGTYVFEMVIFAESSSSTPDIKTRLAFSGTTLKYVRGAATGVYEAVVQNSASSPTTSLTASITPGTPTCIHYKGTLVTGTTGNLTLQWAQNTSDGASTVVMAGSYLSLQKV